MFPPTAPKPGEALCRFDEIEEGGTRSQIWGEARKVFPLMITRRGDRLHAYVNVCPHQFLPLDGYSGEFINADERHIMCIHHAAIFDVTSGACTGGPCRGRSLLPVNVEVRDGEVFMGPWPDPPPPPRNDTRAEPTMRGQRR